MCSIGKIRRKNEAPPTPILYNTQSNSRFHCWKARATEFTLRKKMRMLRLSPNFFHSPDGIPRNAIQRSLRSLQKYTREQAALNYDPGEVTSHVKQSLETRILLLANKVYRDGRSSPRFIPLKAQKLSIN